MGHRALDQYTHAGTSLEALIEGGVYKPGTPLRLHLGAGQTYLSDYINIDLPPEQHKVMVPKVDAYADIISELVFPPESVDEIRLHHVFEHFPRVTAIAQLIKWYYWLKCGGKLMIEVPDFEATVRDFLKASYQHRAHLVRHLVGDQSSQWGFHVEQWWAERFTHTLRMLGYTVVNLLPAKWDRPPFLASLTVVAMKVGQDTLSLQQLTKIGEELLRESMVSLKEEATYLVWCDALRNEVEGCNAL